MRIVLRVVGLGLVCAAVYLSFVGLRQLDRREFVSSALAILAAWFVMQAGVEFVRPESAE